MDYNEIYNQYFQRFVYFADKIINDDDQAKDIAQDSLVIMWKRCDNFANEKALISFGYITVKNACLNHLKKVSKQNKKQESYNALYDDKTEQDIYHHFLWSELLHELSAKIEALPEFERRVFKMIYLEGLTSQEVAIKTGLSWKTIRNQKASAVNKLKLQFCK